MLHWKQRACTVCCIPWRGADVLQGVSARSWDERWLQGCTMAGDIKLSWAGYLSKRKASKWVSFYRELCRSCFVCAVWFFHQPLAVCPVLVSSWSWPWESLTGESGRGWGDPVAGSWVCSAQPIPEGCFSALYETNEGKLATSSACPKA